MEENLRCIKGDRETCHFFQLTTDFSESPQLRRKERDREAPEQGCQEKKIKAPFRAHSVGLARLFFRDRGGQLAPRPPPPLNFPAHLLTGIGRSIRKLRRKETQPPN